MALFVGAGSTFRRLASPKRLGLAFQIRRQDGGWSQGDLARKAGVSRQTLNALEKGKRASDLETMRKVAVALGVALTNLMDFADELEDWLRERAEGA